MAVSNVQGSMFDYAVNVTGQENGGQVVVLPLNLIALIISYVSLQACSSSKADLTMR